jgi:excinuclease ABC subunit C
MKEAIKKKILRRLPDKPGVYLFKGRKDVLYVGKAKSLAKRVRSYFSASAHRNEKVRRMLQAAADLDFVVTDSEMEALILENNFIKQYKPRYNTNLRDDKTYPFLACTVTEAFPRFFLTRQRDEHDGNLYFGPYLAGTARMTLNFIMKEFKLRHCKGRIDGKAARPCLYHDIHRCLGPCVSSLISEKRYRQAVQSAVYFIQGRNKKLTAHLKKEMMRCAEAERFEEAAYYRDLLRETRRLFQPQKATSTRSLDMDGLGYFRSGDRWSVQAFTVRRGKMTAQDIHHMTDRLGLADHTNLAEFIQRYYGSGRPVPPEIALPFEPENPDLLGAWLSRCAGRRVRLRVPARGHAYRLVRMACRNARLLGEAEYGDRADGPDAVEKQKVFGRPADPSHVECFDLSHIQGSHPVASMVCWYGGRLRKDMYRKFKIRTTAGPDDFAGMKEVISRRYRRLLDENRPLPDMILVDGGRGQVTAAEAALEARGLTGRIRVIGLAKREEAIYVPEEKSPLLLPEGSDTLKFLQMLRDEAHRFALTFHRHVRRRETLTSELLKVPGIGRKRADSLIRAFGSVRKIRSAPLASLSRVIGPQIAARLKASLEADRDG